VAISAFFMRLATALPAFTLGARLAAAGLLSRNLEEDALAVASALMAFVIFSFDAPR